MYDYYKGYNIREGNDGIDGAKLRELYEAVGWCGTNMPAWQNEKFEIAKLPCANWSARTTPENYEFYIKCGFSMPEETNATMEYNGFRMSKKDRG